MTTYSFKTLRKYCFLIVRYVWLISLVKFSLTMWLISIGEYAHNVTRTRRKREGNFASPFITYLYKILSKFICLNDQKVVMGSSFFCWYWYLSLQGPTSTYIPNDIFGAHRPFWKGVGVVGKCTGWVRRA